MIYSLSDPTTRRLSYDLSNLHGPSGRVLGAARVRFNSLGGNGNVRPRREQALRLRARCTGQVRL